ncbi:MAG: PP0621 family protein [Caldimonas sp.]
MKFILVLLAFFVLLWLLRGTFGRARPPASRPDAKKPPQPMLACAQCGMHLPMNEALPGRGGVFCGDAHRAAFEKAHPE